MAVDHLLNLPPEVLINIAEHVPREDLMNVRVSCKALDRVARDRWAAEYIAPYICHVRKASALRNLRKIIRTPHLVKKLKHPVGLTLNPNTATGTVEGKFTMNLPLLLEMLREVHEAGCPVRVETFRDPRTRRATDEHLLPALMYNLLYAIVCSGCRLAAIDFQYDEIDLKLLSTPQASSYTNVAQGITDIRYSTDILEEDHDYRSALKKRSGARELIQSAVALKTFWLRGRYLPSEVPFDAKRGAKLCSPFLLANNFSSLRKLRLTLIWCSTAELVTVLDRSRATLEFFEMPSAIFDGQERSWIEVLVQLRDLPKLRHLELGDKARNLHEVVGGTAYEILTCDKKALDHAESGGQVVATAKTVFKNRHEIQELLHGCIERWHSGEEVSTISANRLHFRGGHWVRRRAPHVDDISDNEGDEDLSDGEDFSDGEDPSDDEDLSDDDDFSDGEGD